MSSLSIRKTIAGHIDLSKIVAVRGPFLAGPGSNNAWFEIDVQLRDAPIKCYFEPDFATEVVWENHYYRYGCVDPEKRFAGLMDPLETVIGQRVQKKIDEFVAEWKEWRDA